MNIQAKLAEWLRDNSARPVSSAQESDHGFVLIEHYKEGFYIVTALSRTDDGLKDVGSYFAVNLDDVIDRAHHNLSAATLPY